MTDTNDEIATNSAQLHGLLTEEERAKLSRVLFPDTDTAEVVVLGKTRELRPLPIKPATRLKKAIAPYVAEIQKNYEQAERGEDVDYDAEQTICDSLEKSAAVLADYYGWQDVKDALATDGLPLVDLQTLAVTQSEVNGTNDFLLGNLRTVVQWMRVAEMMTVRFQSTLTGQR